MDKKLLRSFMKREREQLNSEYKETASQMISKSLINSSWFTEAVSIFCYISIEGEPSTTEIISEALKMGKSVFVPKCHGNGLMDAVRIDAQSVLVSGMFHTLEPMDCTSVAKPDQIDLMIVPCVCAGYDGARLGHGAGYYDRFIAQTQAKIVCLCYEKLMSDSIHMEPFDKYMDAVISEKGIFQKNLPVA